MWPWGKKVGKLLQLFNLSSVNNWKPVAFLFSKDSDWGCDRGNSLQAPNAQPLTQYKKPQVFFPFTDSHLSSLLANPPSLPPTIIHLLPAAGRHQTGQEGIMPLFLLRSAIVRRLWLDTRLLLASFLRRSSIVSRVCPWPFGLPDTFPGRSGRKLEEKD